MIDKARVYASEKSNACSLSAFKSLIMSILLAHGKWLLALEKACEKLKASSISDLG
jgi:hypothetical protein